jgi:hypothetical protein
LTDLRCNFTAKALAPSYFTPTKPNRKIRISSQPQDSRQAISIAEIQGPFPDIGSLFS